MKWVFYNARGVWYLLWWAERNARVRKSVGERSESVGKRESAGQRSLITWYRVREMKYKVQRQDLSCNEILRCGGEVLLVFLVCTGEYIYIMWKFKMKEWQLINFTACTKDRRLAQKSNLQNYHIQLLTPVARLCGCHNISESPDWCRAEAVCWCGLALLISQNAGVLSNCFTKL
jgi:hypothetical protein